MIIIDERERGETNLEKKYIFEIGRFIVPKNSIDFPICKEEKLISSQIIVSRRFLSSLFVLVTIKFIWEVLDRLTFDTRIRTAFAPGGSSLRGPDRRNDAAIRHIKFLNCFISAIDQDSMDFFEFNFVADAAKLEFYFHKVSLLT